MLSPGWTSQASSMEAALSQAGSSRRPFTVIGEIAPSTRQVALVASGSPPGAAPARRGGGEEERHEEPRDVA